MNRLAIIRDCTLSIECRCGRRGSIDVNAMIERYGENVTDRDILDRAKCDHCGKIGQTDVRIISGHKGTPKP